RYLAGEQGGLCVVPNLDSSTPRFVRSRTLGGATASSPQSPPLVRPHQMEARITLHSGGNPEQRSPRVDLPWRCGHDTGVHIQRREVRMHIAVNEARTETAPAQIVAPPLAPKPTSDRNVAARERAQHACRASEVDVWPPTILNPVRTALSICGDSTSSPIS